MSGRFCRLAATAAVRRDIVLPSVLGPRRMRETSSLSSRPKSKDCSREALETLRKAAARAGASEGLTSASGRSERERAGPRLRMRPSRCRGGGLVLPGPLWSDQRSIRLAAPASLHLHDKEKRS